MYEINFTAWPSGFAGILIIYMGKLEIREILDSISKPLSVIFIEE